MDRKMDKKILILEKELIHIFEKFIMISEVWWLTAVSVNNIHI